MNLLYTGIGLIFVFSILYFFLWNIVAIIGVIFFLAFLVFVFVLVAFFVMEDYPQKKINFIKFSYLVICCSTLYYLFLYPELKYNNVENYIGRYIHCEVEIVKSSPKVNRTIELPSNNNCGYTQEPSIILMSNTLKVQAVIEFLYLLSFLSLTTLFWFLRKLYLKLFCYLGSLLNSSKKARKKNL